MKFRVWCCLGSGQRNPNDHLLGEGKKSRQTSQVIVHCAASGCTGYCALCSCCPASDCMGYSALYSYCPTYDCTGYCAPCSCYPACGCTGYCALCNCCPASDCTGYCALCSCCPASGRTGYCADTEKEMQAAFSHRKTAICFFL